MSSIAPSVPVPGHRFGILADNNGDTYRAARARALALAPAVRGERAMLEAIPPPQGRAALAPYSRKLAVAAVLVATIIGSVEFAGRVTPSTIVLGGAFGLATVAAGDRLGAAMRGIHARRELLPRLALAFAVLSHGAEMALLALAAALLARPLAGAAVGALGLAVASIGFASRIGDTEFEIRAAIRAAARHRLDASERALARASDALRANCEADLAEIAAKAGRPMPGGEHGPAQIDPPALPRLGA